MFFKKVNLKLVGFKIKYYICIGLIKSLLKTKIMSLSKRVLEFIKTALLVLFVGITVGAIMGTAILELCQ